MLSPVLSVLLLGLLPVLGGPSDARASSSLQSLSIAPPVLPLASVTVISRLRRRVTASGMIIIDRASGQEVFSRDADTRRPMASLTKLMTAVLLAEDHAMDEWVEIPASTEGIEGTMARLGPGEHYTVGSLLTALLVASSNDAAHALAVHHSGSEEQFIAAMNERARMLGLQHTSYANSMGLDDPAQWSTPRDVAWLAAFVTRNQEIRRRLGLKDATIWSREGRSLALSHTLTLLHGPTPVVAGKTGTTNGAGQCLMSIVREGGREYIVVLFSSRERYADLRRVLEALASLLV